MRRIAAVLLLGLRCGGCFESEKPLYTGVKPLQPFAAGEVIGRDKDGKTARMTLALSADGAYRLTSRGPGEDRGKGDLVRFFALNGAPSGLLLAEVRECGSDFRQCASGTGWYYLLIRSAAGRVEWHIPDCSGALSRLAGITVESDSCKFRDRASLEKALGVAATLPWAVDGSYTFASAGR
jgi:hypothetical protein